MTTATCTDNICSLTWRPVRPAKSTAINSSDINHANAKHTATLPRYQWAKSLSPYNAHIVVCQCGTHIFNLAGSKGNRCQPCLHAELIVQMNNDHQAQLRADLARAMHITKAMLLEVERRSIA